MNKQEIQSRIKSLRKEIDHHRFLYHVHDKQEISEDALDALKHELAKLEEQYPEFITPDSPTQRIGGRPLAEFKKVKHQIKQWSFNDAFDEKEIRAFDERVKKELNRAGVKTKNVDYSVELKIDGLHVVLTYEKGKLAVGATRGDGKIGEDVTQNIKTIESLPLNLVEAVDVIVEGEVFMPKHVFDELNKKQKKLGKPLFANP